MILQCHSAQVACEYFTSATRFDPTVGHHQALKSVQNLKYNI